MANWLHSLRLLAALAVSILLCSTVTAQNLAVADFYADVTDQTANSYGTTVTDQNGEKCALIKVESTLTGLTFDIGSLGVTEVKQKAGEVWVYVPHGAKHITIGHAKMGMVRNYYFTEKIESARVYVLKLVSGSVDIVVKEMLKSQFVELNVQPANSLVYIDGELQMTDGGVLNKELAIGQHEYRVVAARHHTDAGKFAVTAEEKTVLNVKLLPAYGSLTVNTIPAGARVYVDAEERGIAPLTLDRVESGSHQLVLLCQGCKPVQQVVEIADGKNTPVELTLATHGAKVKLVAKDADDEIWMGGKLYGKGGWSGVLTPGNHTVEVRHDGYRGTVVNLELREKGDTVVTLPQLQAMLGHLKVTVVPEGATVLIDGVDKGKAPLMLQNILAGRHEIRLMKMGYDMVVDTIDINENKTLEYTQRMMAGEGPKMFSVRGVDFTMIPVGGGSFRMGAGSNEEFGSKDELPAHEVMLSNFYIGQTEVTQAVWYAVMGTNPSEHIDLAKPVTNVSWDDCQTFISKLNELTGEHFRLPTEAEWEYAARGGRMSKHTPYSGSASPDGVAYFEQYGGPAVCKSKQPNELGLYDMSGNAFEWCADYYGRYPSAGQSNPQGPQTGQYRVMRGGCWAMGKQFCTVVARTPQVPTFNRSVVGLRLAK